MGLLKTLLIGRENGIRSTLRKTLFGGASVDTSPDSAYSAPTNTPSAAAPTSTRPEPPRDVTPPEGFEVVLHTDALKPGEVTEVIAGGTAICVGNVDGEYHAISNTCAHADGPLGEGSLDGSVLTCPYHGWEYDITSGACQTNADVSVTVYEVQVDQGAVCVRL